MGSESWCAVCHTRHGAGDVCPGQVLVTEAERHGWRMLVDTGTRTEAWGVLVARGEGCARARLVTYPNRLWAIPGGRGTMKFVAPTPAQAEAEAIAYLREHCRERGFRFLGEAAAFESAPVEPESAPEAAPAGEGPAPRHLRFLPVRFGAARATDRGLTANLSLGGLFVIADDPLERGSEVRLVLELDDFAVPLRGRVVWSRPTPEEGRPAGMGVQLLEAPPPIYLRFVERLGERESS